MKMADESESSTSSSEQEHPISDEQSNRPLLELQNLIAGPISEMLVLTENREVAGESGGGQRSVLAQARVVNQLIKTIGRLRGENAILELRISDSDKQNKLLQLQIDILMKKMDILESFMSQVKDMDDENNEKDNLCRKCKQKIEKNSKSEKSPDISDSEDVDLKELMDSWCYSGNQECENASHNPLLIDVIVGHVMKFLSIGNLLRCRLVSHLWCQEATYVLKQRQTLTVNQDNIEKLPKLIQLKSDENSLCGGFLFRRVKFEINFLVKAYREMLEEFFSAYGSEIHHFSLYCEQENSSIMYTEEVRNIFLPLLKNIKVLELSVPTKITERQTIYDDIRPKKFHYDQLITLKLRQMDVSLDIGGYSVASVKELLETAPNLRKLYIETHTKEVVTRILQALNDPECQHVSLQLEELYLDAIVTEEHLRLLFSLNCKLKALQMSYFTVEATTAMMEACLIKHRNTLKTLIIGDYQKRTTANSLPMIIKLPTLRELRHLKFVDPLFPDHRQIMLNPLNYAEQLPLLSELSFEHENGKPAGPHYFQDMFSCSLTSCATLTCLRISHGLGDPQLVSAAAKMFPNVTTLELDNAPDSVIQAVWKEFTGIKILHLFFSPANVNIDSLMTGIPDQVCRRIQEKNLFSQVDIMNALDIIRTEPGICNLTELTTLRIDGFTSSLITAVTGYLSLCHMKNLSNISVKSDCITLSRECRRVLGETLHLSTFDIF